MKQKQVELLPTGMFSIIRKDGERIPGRFSMYAWDLFLTDQNSENFADMMDMLQKGFTLKQAAGLLRFALNDYDRQQPKYMLADVMDLIDICFEKGHNDPEFIALMYHAVGRVATLAELPEIPGLEKDAESEEEKKRE